MTSRRGGNLERKFACSLTLVSGLIFLFVFDALPLAAQSSDSPPPRWQAKYTQIYSEDFEGSHPGIQLFSPSSPPGQQNSAVLTSDPALVIAGKTSARIGWFGKLVTAPSALPLVGNATYIVEFQYHILNIGAASDILHLDLQPVGTTDPQLQVNFTHMQLAAPATGTFSAGGFLPGGATYVLTITSQQQTDVVIDNLTVYRQDAVQTSTAPPAWARLETLPFPRLGKYENGTAGGDAAVAPSGSPYTLEYIESTMAFFDLTFGVAVYAQTESPQEIQIARQLNPNAVILPYRVSEEQDTNTADLGAEPNSNVNLDVSFLQSLSTAWYLRDAEGRVIYEQSYPATALMNVSSYCPVINGNTYISSVVNYLNAQILPSGEWDGVFFDNLYGSINTNLSNYQNPALLDIDIQRNGTRSTPAAVSDMATSGGISILQQLRQSNLDSQLIMGNVGARDFQGYLNGILLECANHRWNPGGTTTFSPASWRAAFDSYRIFQDTTRRPRVNSLEGCGPIAPSGGIAGFYYPLPTADDLTSHRMTMGTALLDNGFYGFDLHGSESPPLWYDEYSVNATGTAVRDVAQKGYLGQALSEATEVASAGSVLLQDTFEGVTLAATWTPGAAAGTSVTISHDPSEVISGSGSLVLSNPSHSQQGGISVSTNPNVVRFTAGNSYLLTFDWRIVETLDTLLGVAISTNPSQPLDLSSVPSVQGGVAGNHGIAHFPFTIPSSGPWSVSIYIVNGGKVAIDNVTITQGNVGPWRRDFENGFVLVNPLSQPHTFSAAELAGSLNRTGIHRIRGTQAPAVNNGQPVTGDLTLSSFDAIILLADRINAPVIPPASRPSILANGVISASAFGAFSGISPGSFIEIYGTNLAATRRGWSGADFNGTSAPTSLDGVSVLVGGRPAYVSYVSPNQINALVASDAAVGQMQIVVNGPTGTSDPYLINVEATQPGLFAPSSFQVGGKQFAGALFPDNQTFALPSGALPGVPSRPARPGDAIVLYGIGFGPVTPNYRAGTLVGDANSLTNSLQLFFGNTSATLSYEGLAQSLTGVYQFNVVVPDVPDGSVPLSFKLGGVIGTQNLYVAVQR